MRLSDNLRHLAAALVACVLFPALYIGANLSWWLSLVIVTLAYTAALVFVFKDVVQAPPPPQVSEADVAWSADTLRDTARSLVTTSSTLPAAEAAPIAALAEHLLSIRESLREDPALYPHTRQFVHRQLQRICDRIESAAITEETEGLQEWIATFEPHIAELDSAAIRDDAPAIAQQIDAIETLLGTA